ncbi:MAG: hypothetical protein J5798_06275 [Spirochaetaceae bacterium]|nr:hypothetical protein [Spirochaetaceae bacterium]
MIEYEMMIPPFEMVQFEEMNKKQVQEHFDWYIGQISHRLSLILNTIKEDNIDVDLDYSIESLIPLWEWYETKISYRKLDDSEYQSRISNRPKWMKDCIDDEDLSWETLMYCMDVALYFAEVIIKHNATIKWGYFTNPKNRANVNQPVLLGFKYNKDLNPRLIVENCTRRSGREKLSTRLYDMYYTWMKYL